MKYWLEIWTEVETSVPWAKISQIPYQLSCSVNLQKYHVQLNVTDEEYLLFFGEQIMPYFLTPEIKIHKKNSEEWHSKNNVDLCGKTVKK